MLFRSHILFECRGWGRAFTDYHIVYEETNITPAGPIDNDGSFDKTPQFRWLSDQEIWEAHEKYHTCNVCERQHIPPGHTCTCKPHSLWKTDESPNAELSNRKLLFYRNWEDISLFLKLNPMACTFAWVNLTEAATKDKEEGLRLNSSVPIFKAFAHSRGRRLARIEFWKKWKEKAKRDFSRIPSDKKGKIRKWEGLFPPPVELEF